ncbi:hypothetical protein [Streptomyces sp. NPDC046371]|uniref:hypothetical protein n=1 Tax=unclassified Streptomyces TaxID=2593676 RepID=UPI0033E447EA
MTEARVTRYLRERGYTLAVEPEFGTGRHPDYLTTAGEHTLVAEVKALETCDMFENTVRSQVMHRSSTEDPAPTRKQITAWPTGARRGARGRRPRSRRPRR